MHDLKKCPTDYHTITTYESLHMRRDIHDDTRPHKAKSRRQTNKKAQQHTLTHHTYSVVCSLCYYELCPTVTMTVVEL